MPKVSVITLPSEAVQAPGRATAPGRPARKISRSRIFRRLGEFVLSIVRPDYLLVNVLAFLLARVSILGEMAPFGLAFFAAVAHTAPQRAFITGLWATAGVLSAGHYPEAGVYGFSIVLYLRLADKLSRLERKMLAIPLFFFASVTLSGLAFVAWQQATLYSVLLVLFDAALCMVLACLFAYGTPLFIARRPGALAGEGVLYAVIILAVAVAGLGDFSVWGYSLRNMTGSLLVMALALAGGPGLGAAAGVAVGLVVGLSDGNASMAIALYSLAGLSAGLVRLLGKFAVIGGFVLGSALTVLYFGDTLKLVTILTEIAVAGGLLLVVPARRLAWWQSGQATAGEAGFDEDSERLAAAAAKLTCLAELFHDLAGALGEFSDDVQGEMRHNELTALLATVGERVCGPCERRSACWDHDFYRTYQAMLDTLALAETGALTAGSLPKPLRDSCVRRKEVAETVTAVAERSRTAAFWHKKIGQSRRIVSEQIKAAGAVIANLVQEIRRQPQTDEEMARSLKDKAALIECPVDEVRVSGIGARATVEICKHPCSGARECLNTLLPLAANLLHEKMTLHAECGNAMRRKKCRLTMQVAQSYQVLTGMASAAKDTKGVCGDTCMVMPLSRGRVALVLSDGMGSGNEAATESGRAVKFLQRLLAAGFDVDLAVKTVNSMLVLRSPDETFATIDMAIIDTYSGEAEFLKIGSAPSFVKRVREVATIKSASLPIGILSQIEFDPVEVQLAAGDIIVMVSDGVADAPYRGPDKENWVANFLRRTASVEPQEIADKLLCQAQELSGAKLRDDMTVLVAKICDRSPLVQ
ncbi:stage II sporulation protein E [Sporolituus thermophilus]|uniref:Stage II sporulation protein E n=1 Tax=Sporolituus thermophilus DSM 23256 TaxID=1123285 RepID=A0A1G7IWN1_9FIRM|nr:stage II sporulation protein E [Sporolituus thermophilus]SDF17063.1 stage II sporulation protein E [Sporolituus thermophilus DSM 23256]